MMVSFQGLLSLHGGHGMVLSTGYKGKVMDDRTGRFHCFPLSLSTRRFSDSVDSGLALCPLAPFLRSR